MLLFPKEVFYNENTIYTSYRNLWLNVCVSFSRFVEVPLACLQVLPLWLSQTSLNLLQDLITNLLRCHDITELLIILLIFFSVVIYPLRTVFTTKCPTIIIKDKADNPSKILPSTSSAHSSASHDLNDEDKAKLNEGTAHVCGLMCDCLELLSSHGYHVYHVNIWRGLWSLWLDSHCKLFLFHYTFWIILIRQIGLK